MFESLGILNLGIFVVGVVVIIITPGPNSLYVLSTATRRGVRAGYTAAAAVFVGDSVLMLAASLGVDSLVRLYPSAFSAVQYAGAVFLCWLGAKALRAAFQPGGEGAATDEPCRENPFRRALVLSLSNPKAILFFVSFFVQFVDPSKGRAGLAFLVLAGIVQVVSLSYLSILIFGGAKIASAFKDSQLAQRLGTAFVGFVFIGFGCRLALMAASA